MGRKDEIDNKISDIYSTLDLLEEELKALKEEVADSKGKHLCECGSVFDSERGLQTHQNLHCDEQ